MILKTAVTLGGHTTLKQNETISDEDMFGTCSRLRLTEQQSYDAQNAFLRSEGVLFRAGIGMRMIVCPDDM